MLAGDPRARFWQLPGTVGLLQQERCRFLGLAEAKRNHAGQQLVQQDSERVDVATGVDVPRAEAGLLGAHVFQSTDHIAHLSLKGFFGQREPDSLGDTEIDDLDFSLPITFGDEDVGRLDIAMNDALLVGMLDRSADLHEELDSLSDVELTAVAIGRDGLAVDVLHDEVGQAFVRHPCVIHLCDVSMTHQGEGLALGREAVESFARAKPWFENLESDLALYGIFLASQEDRSHTALNEALL